MLVNGYDMNKVYFDKTKFLIAMAFLTNDPIHFKVSILFNQLNTYTPNEKKQTQISELNQSRHSR
jgi:hypothetical protein